MGVLIKNKVNYSGGKLLMSPECYSTEEKEIGCWINGKPLYQRTWDFGSNLSVSYSSWTASPIPKDGFDTIVQCVNGLIDNQQACWGILSTSLEVNNTYIALLCGRYANNCNVRYLTLQYTKTTDQPGSGTWTPQGVPAVHYSTDEHVVGTWIDGSTVYEKVVETTFNNASPRYTLDLSTMDGTPITLIDASNSFLYYDNNGTQIVQVATQAATNYTSSTLTYNHQQGAVTGKAYVTIRYIKREVMA